MPIEGISESVEVMSYGHESNYRDSLAGSVTKVGKNLIFPCRTLFELLEVDFIFAVYFHPGEYGQSHDRIQEIAKRIFGLVKIPLVLFFSSFALLGFVFVRIGAVLSTKDYRIDYGEFRGKASKEIKLMLLNPHMLKRASSLRNQGLLPANHRIDRLIETIQDNRPDIAFIPNVDASTRRALRNRLCNDYHYFFSSIGEKKLGSGIPFFIAFRGTLKSAPQFIRFGAQNLAMVRGFFAFETEDTCYLFAHDSSLEDLEEICTYKKEEKKVVLIGDLGFERESPLFEYLQKQGFISFLEPGEPTETNAPYLHLYNLEEKERKFEKGVVFIKQGKGVSKAIPMHLDSKDKVGEALSNQSMILTRLTSEE